MSMGNFDEKPVAEKPVAESPAQANQTLGDRKSITVVFSKPYKFEGKEYTELDLSGLEDITAENMIAADKYLVANSVMAVQPEANMLYTLFIASSVTGLPIEFFRALSPKDAIKIKNRVTVFFYGED